MCVIGSAVEAIADGSFPLRCPGLSGCSHGVVVSGGDCECRMVRLKGNWGVAASLDVNLSFLSGI